MAAQREQIAVLRQRVVTLNRILFGKSSEKGDPGKPDAGDGGSTADGGRAPGRRRSQRPGSAGHGRGRHEHLDSEEQVHDLPEGERCCPVPDAARARACCRRPRVRTYDAMPGGTPQPQVQLGSTRCVISRQSIPSYFLTLLQPPICAYARTALFSGW